MVAVHIRDMGGFLQCVSIIQCVTTLQILLITLATIAVSRKTLIVFTKNIILKLEFHLKIKAVDEYVKQKGDCFYDIGLRHVK